MTTAAERLVALAGAGGIAATLLLSIGSGGTAGAALVNYSGLASATAEVHLLTDVSDQPSTGGGGGGSAAYFASRPKLKPLQPKDEDSALFMIFLQ